MSCNTDCSNNHVVSQPPIGQAIAILYSNINNFDNIFKFKSTSTCISYDNISNTNEYAVDISNWNKNDNVLYSNSLILSNNVGGSRYISPSIKTDYVRHISSSVTGGYNSSDLFSNENSLKQEVIDLDDDLDNFIKSKLESLGGTLSNPITDISNNLVRNSIILPLLNSSECGRIKNLFTENRDTTQWMSVPLYQGDTIEFEINYKPVHPSPLGDNIISDKKYTIRINLTN